MSIYKGVTPKPIFVEVFTDADKNAELTNYIYGLYSSDIKKKMIKFVRKVGSKVMGEGNMIKIYNTLTKGEEEEEKLVNHEHCTGCFACYAACPQGAIKREIIKGFYYPKIDENLCINCRLCTAVCKGTNETELIEPIEYIGMNSRSEKVRSESTSGGAFYMIAKRYLESGGVVYGAAFRDDFSVEHIRCADFKELKKIQKSKYVQSDTSRIYNQIEEDVRSGKKILFSGTACQCSGVKSYLKNRKMDDADICYVDLICHGVPSPVIWKEYLEYRIAERHLGIKNIVFRDKKKSWRDFRFLIEYNDGKIKTFRQNEDYFLVLFFHNLILRGKCYSCRYATTERMGDITIGDYWGVWEFSPELYDDKGTSVIFINTDKGEICVDGFLNDAKHVYIDEEQVIKHQINLRHPSEKGNRHNEFWNDYEQIGLPYCLSKYADATLWGKVKRHYVYGLLWDMGLWNSILKIRDKII